MSKIEIVLKNVGEEPKLIEIESNIDEFQKIVEGYVEAIRITDDGLYMFCNEEGRIFGLKRNFSFIKHPIRDDILGNVFFARNTNAETSSVKKSDLELVKNLIHYFV